VQEVLWTNRGETKICEFNSKGRKGTITERLIELMRNEKTVWTMESDTMGMSKIFTHDFVFTLKNWRQGGKRILLSTRKDYEWSSDEKENATNTGTNSC